MASPGRFELPAFRLGGGPSIQLRYGDILNYDQFGGGTVSLRRRTLYPTEVPGHIGYYI